MRVVFTTYSGGGAMNMRSLMLVGFAVLLLAGCSPNVVSLQYQPRPELGPECTGQVTILPFQDATAKRELGTNRKGGPIFSDIAVERWVREAFADQLEAQGCRVRVSAAADSGYALSGKVLGVDLQQISSSQYQAYLRLEVLLREAGSGGEKLYQERLGVKVDKQFMPGTKNAEDVLQELMQDLMQAVSSKLVSYM
jgi:uncharacterized lipoprotein YajG